MSQQPDTSFEIDQGFQSLKSREVSDAMGPNEMQFQSTVLKYPNTGGWNVQSAAEVSPDGRAYRTETVATTDGVENIEGGKAEYQGFNEQRSSGLHEGDDKNFIKQSMESSKTHLQEKFVSGDANSDHLEVRTSSSTQSSSSKVVQSSSTVEYDNEYAPSNRQLLKSTYRDAPPYGKQNFPDDPYLEKIQQQEYYNKQSRKQSLNSEEIQSRTFQYNEKLENKNSMQNIETHQTVENEKRYVDLDKASPEYQKHVQYLMSQPGEIISNTVEYPKPNVKMITTVKRLPDGTIVRNKRYETEEVGSSRPLRENLQTVSSTKRLHNQQISDQKTGLRTTEDRRHSRDDYIVHDTHADEITNVKISSTKKSNEKYATESTTKVMHEYDEDNYRQTSNSSPQRAIYKGQSPHNDNPSYEQREPLRNYTGTPQLYDSPRDKPNTHVYDRRIPNDEGEIVIVTSEKKQNIEKQSSSQHTTQTEIVADDIINYEQYPQIRDSSPKKIVAEFSPVKGPSHKTFEIEPNVNQFHGVPTDYERHRTPNEKAPNHLIHVIENTEHTEHKTLENRRTLNEEHSLILENNNVRTPEKSAGHPPVNQRNASNFPTKELSSHEKPTTSSTHPEKTVLVPSNKQRTPDFTTQGFPSQVKPSVPSNICIESSDRKGTLDFTTQGFPSQVNHTVPTKYAENTFVEPLNKKNVPDFSTHGFPSQVKVTSPNKRPDNTYENNPYGTKPAPTTYNKDDTHKKPLDKSTTPDFSSHGFPSQPESTSLRQPGSLKSSTGGSPPQENSVPSMGHPGNYSEAPEYFRNQESPSRTTAPYPSTLEEPLERDNKHPKSTQIKSYPTIYDEPSERNNKHPKSSQGYPSQTKPSSPYPTIYDEPSEKDNKHLKSTQDYHSQTKPSPTNYNKSSERDNTHSKSTQGYPSQTKPLSPYPSTYDEPPERNNKHLKTSQGYPSQTSIYAEPSEHNNKHLKSTQGYPSQTKPPSPIKKPVSNVVEVTQKVIKKEREVDAAHRAFASSLRSSSPIESRRDSYMDTQRHTSRSSASSNRTLKRDMRESSHDSSAPSETSRTSTNTVTKRIPSTTLQIKQTVPITNKNINSYEANRKNTKSPINRNVISPQTKRTPLGGTTLREPFKSDNQNTKLVDFIFSINDPLTTRLSKTTISENNATPLPNEVVEEPCIKKSFYLLGPTDELTLKKTEEPSNLPASSRKDFTNSKHKIPSDDIYQTRSHNQPLVESPQSMRNNEHRTVSNETSLTTNFDIKHDQRSIILPDTSTPEVLDDDEVVDAFWRKPNKNREKPGNQSKETTVKQIDGLSNNQRRVSEELKKPKTTLIGVKEVRNVHPNKTTLQKKPTYKEPVSSYKVRPYKVVDDISLPEKPQLKTKASTSVARKTSSSVISGRKTLVTNTKTENIYSNEYIEDSNYDNNILFDREKDTHTYKQLVAKDTKTLSKIHSKVNKKSSLDKALPHNLPFDKPNKQQNKMQESQKSPEQNRKASQIHQAQKEVQKPHVKRSGKNEKFKPDEPMDNLVSRTPSHKAHYTEPKFGINSKSTSSTRTSNIEKIDTQYEYQPIVSPKSPTRKSQSPEPGNNMGTHPSTYTPTTFESEMRHPEEQFEYESMKLRKSPAPEYESPSPEHNFRGNVFAFTTTKHISDTQQLEEHLEFERIKSRKSPNTKPEIVEPKRNFGTITPTFTTGLHKPNIEQHESQPDIQSTKSTKSPTYKSESPEPKVNFETTVSTFTTSMRASDTQQYKDQSGESPIRKPETTEHISNFRKSTSPFTTTNVEQVETQHEPMDSRKSPTHKSKSPESTIKLETTSSMITTTAHKSDTQQYEEFEHRSEFQPIKSQKSSAREPKPTETKPNFGKANSPNAKKPEARRYGKSEKSKTHKTEYTEPTDNFDTNSSTITATMHKSGTQQYEQLEDQPQFKPRESQKSLAREPETLETRPSFEKAVSPFSPSNVEQPEIQRQQKPQKSATHKNELSESTIKFGTNISTITSTTHKSDTRQHEESLKFQPKNSQKSLTHRPERSESRPNLEKTTSDLTTRKFYEEPEEWPALQPTKSCKSPTHIYESPKPEVNFETDSPTVTVIKGKPDTRKPEERHFEPTKRGDSPTRYHETVESQPSLGKPICIPTDTIYKHDKEEPSDDQSTKFPKPSARGFKCTDIQSMRYSPVFNPELSESTIHFESSDTEKILSEEELSKTKTRSENLTYRKSPSPGVSQKIDLFNKNPTSKKPSVSSKESNKPFPSSCTTDYEHITFTKNVEQSSLKKFTDEEYETPETDEDLSKSTGTKPFKADNSGKEKIPTDRYNTTKNKIPSTSNKHINLEFIKSERKSTEPELFDGARISKVPETISPTLTNYSKKGVSLRETFEERCRHTLGMKDHGIAHGTFTNQLKPIEYEVKNLEDENEDYTGNKKKIKEIIDEQTDSQKPYNAPLEKFVKPTNQTIYNETHNYNEVRNYTTTDKLSYDSEKPDHQRVYMDISSTTEPKEKVKIPKNFSTDEDTLIEDETFPDVNQVSPDQINFTLKVKKAQPSRDYDNTNAHNQLKKTPEKSEKPKQQKQSPQIFTTLKDVPSSRPSTVGKPKSKSLLDKSPTRSSQDVNGASSSETSPNRISDARKSSIISVNTEIITDHMSSKYEDIKKSSNPIVKPKRKSISTERKDSAPVPRVTRHMKDAKVSHSVSENIIKVKGKPKRGINRQSEKLPKKCFAAKTINLAVRDNTDMENVIIDIQHAKSSREVSSNKIVPTPVPADLDVGHLRYPDLIREPEDEPQRKPIEKSIPIYEEETNEYIGCHISEIYNENSTFREENVCTINNDVQTTDDECLLSVQEKVSKFTKSADEVTKSKSSSPFSREYDKNTRVPEDDQCLLTINEKVSKFQKNTTDIDDVQQNITTSKGNVPTKLRPSAPQKSPELVRSISKQMSTPQIESKFDEKDNIRRVPQFDDNDNNINVLEARHQKDILSKPSCTQNTTTILKQNQRKKHERVSSNYEDAYTEVENAQFNNLAQKLPLGRTDGASTNLENTFDNNNVEYSIISQENQQFIEHSRAHDQPITKHNRGFENEPINVTASIFSPIKKVTESTIINKTHRKSISSDDEARNISGQTKAKVVPHTSTKVVTARRNVFEKNVHTDKPKKLDPTTPTLTGRRPSYMDHTKCSLEHIRRDSLEINKSNYSRKLYREDEGQTDRITSVKFDIPQRMAKEEPLNPEDEVNIEEIYDIEILEQMLQTVISYELSRRIRAQILRIRKESRNEIDSSLKKMYKLVDDKSDKRHGTNEIVVTTSDAEYETIIPKYGKTEVKPKPSSLSPERGYNRYNNTPDSDRFSKCPSKLQTSQNISVKKPIKFTKSTIKLSNTDSHNRKGSPDQEFDDRNTFSRNSIDRKTFTKETNVIKKQYENVSKRSNAKFKPFNSRSSSPGAASQTMTTSEFATAKHLREYCPEISRASVEYNFTQDFKSQPHESIVRDRSTSPKSKPHGHGSPNILETQIPKGIARDNVTHEKSYHTTRDERSNIQKNVHNKRNINNINERSSLKLDEKRKNANEVTPIWANRNNVLRSSTTQKSSNIETQAKEMKFSAVHKDVKNVNKATSIEQDSVISSYGIGPTDDHGIPLFGIKALRKKPMTSNVTKDITGCVIEEKYYSDNKSEPIVQRKETYYSTNPDQLKEVQGKDKIKQFTDKDTGLYVLSKTDQEASENIMKSSLSRTHHDHDNTSLIDADINQENIINKSAWRVINNPDCYDASSHMEESNQTYTENYSDVDDESFKNYHPISTSETNKEREIYSTSARSFTNLSSSNEKRISSVSDVLQLMRNADHVIEEGDTEETHEARALLNKFIGASVIMNGAEVSLPKEFILGTTADHNNKNSLKQQEVQIIRKKKTKSGNSSSIVTRTTTCDLQDIWDEDILKQLLEQAETYEDRRKIRARLRELMAEREEINTVRSQTLHIDIFDEDDSGSSIYEDTVEDFDKIDVNLNDKSSFNKSIEIHLNNSGENFKQAIEGKTTVNLDKITKSAKAHVILESNMSTVGRSIKLDNKSNSVKNQVELAKLAIPIKEDSGTESGEDLRSIAAGICDQLQVIDNTSVIDEVTAALERLERSLREGRDITIDIEKRKALLELVWRLQAGLKSPEKLSEIAAAMSELEYGKMSLETDTVYSNKHRFAKRRGRVTRHTIGVSHEELASARRHILKNTRSPEKLVDNQSVSSWYSLVPSTTYNEYEYEPRTLQSGLKPEQFTYNSNTLFQKPIWSEDLDKKRPLSGNYSEQFSNDHSKVHNILQPIPQKVLPNSLTQYDADIENVDHFNSNRKYFIRRANTIDIPKAKKDLIESNTGSENEEKNSLMGLKSVIQVGVKKPPEKVIPPFEAKTENDRKFLAFINKHSDKPGLISSNSRSVSNWSNKFDSLKHNFELGAQQIAKKPPQMPGHVSSKAQWNKLSNVQYEEPLKKFTAIDDKVTMFKKYPDNQKAAQSSIHDNHFDKHRKESENLLIPQHNSTFHKPIAINQFKHASSSVFKRVENIESKPIHDAYSKMDLVYRQNNTNEYPNVYTYTKADNYFVQTPPPSTNYVPSLPWAPKLNDTKNEMNKETNESSVLFSKQLNSTHMAKSNQINEYKKRPSLPNTSDINRYNESIFKQPKSLQYTNLSDLPPPTNISIIYANGMHRPSFNSSPCLSTAMQSENLCSGSHKREDSLTNPDALPLVLTADNPLYAPGELQHTSLSSTSVLSTPSTLSMYPENNTESPILTEHHAISKVMNKPQSLTAVTIEKRTNHVSDNDQFLDGNTQSAKNLLTAMKSINKTTNKNAKSDKKAALNQLNCEFAQNLSKLNSLKPTNKSLNTQNLLKSKPEQMYATSNSKINKAEKCLNNMAPSLNLNCEKYTNTNAPSSIQSKQVSNLELDKTARKNPSVPINAIMEKKPTLDQKIYNISYEINNNKKKIRKEHVISESSIVGKEIYSNAAPLDTPDIVKSSLPKDESQTVLKNYGPPQRHHYVPNAYQNPLSANTYAYKKQQNINSKMAASNRPQEDDYIPRNIVHNNVSAFTCLSRNQKNAHVANFHKIINSNNASMQKAQFHIPQITQTIPKHFNCPILSPSELRRSKSGHNLSVPKMYEAGINKADIDEKQKTVAAYFLGQKSPTYQLTQYQQYQQQQASTESSSVLRRKSPNYCTATNEVNRKSLILNGSIQNVSPSALSRSATMPHIPNVHLLDESNVEDAFEQLISEDKEQQEVTTTTEKIQGKSKNGRIMTTTTKVLTRSVTGGSSNKPISPFTKFKQLETKNSQQKQQQQHTKLPKISPSQLCASTTTTTSTSTSASASVSVSTTSTAFGNSSLVQYVDPVLNTRAATVKGQLLQWCQTKTSEYENIKITNFSTSWSDGLAFCALIHHFLPNAFDYHQLTAKNRRKNFEIAFTVADEKAGITPLLDVEDMVVMKCPDWKCVFVYVQSIYQHFRNCP